MHPTIELMRSALARLSMAVAFTCACMPSAMAQEMRHYQVTLASNS